MYKRLLKFNICRQYTCNCVLVSKQIVRKEDKIKVIKDFFNDYSENENYWCQYYDNINEFTIYDKSNCHSYNCRIRS